MKAERQKRNFFVFGFGVLGAWVMLLASAIGQTADPKFHAAVPSFEIFLGSILTGQSGTGTWMLGFILFLLIGGITALIYSFGFRIAARAGWYVGACFGLAHWCAMAITQGMIPSVNPLLTLQPSSDALTRYVVIPPDYYGLGMSFRTLFSLAPIYILYGAGLGEFHRWLYGLKRPALTAEQFSIEELDRNRTHSAEDFREAA